MKKKDIGKKAKQGILWSGASSVILFVTRFGTSMILARLLFPEDFGLMGMATVVIQFAQRLTSFGFNLAVVQRKKLEPEHLDTVFTINLLFLSCITAIVYFAADYVSNFFNNTLLAPILRVVSVLFILRGLMSVNQAILMRKMKFKELAFAHIFSQSVTFISPIFFALANYGVWSLVWGRVLGASTASCVLFYHTRWYPKFKFRIWALKDIFSFGAWIFVVRYLTYFINKLDYIFIGKFLGASELGFYERAYNLMDIPRGQLQSVTSNVLFSSYSKIQDDDERIVKVLKKVIISVSVLAYGMSIWMFFAAPSLIVTLFGHQWTSSILPLKIMCFSGLVYAMTILFFPILNAKSLMAKRAGCQFIYLTILATSMWYGLERGIVGVAWSVTISSSCYLVLILLLISSNLPFSPKDFLLAQRSAFVYGCIQVAVLMTFCHFAKNFLTETSILMLIGITGLSAVTYGGSLWLIKFEEVQEPLEDMLKEFRKLAKKVPVLKSLLGESK